MHFLLLAAGFAAFGTSSLVAAIIPCKHGEWVNLAPIQLHPRQEHGTVAIKNTTVAILGGVVPNGDGVKTTGILQLYDIASNTWKTASPAPYAVNHPNLAVIDTTLYLLGGLADGPEVPGQEFNWVASTRSYAYDLATDTWSDLPPMPSGTERGSAIVGVYNEMIYLAGGMTVLQTSYQDAVNIVTAFNTTSGEWQRLGAEAAEIPESRQHGAGAVIGDIFYVVGGRRFGQNNTRDTVFELDLTNPEAGWRTSDGRMFVPRGGLSGAAVGDQFYTFGGEGSQTSSNGIFNESEVFDTVSEKWMKLAPMDIPRHGTQAAAAGGRIYIPGGGLEQGGTRPTDVFDVYCP